MGSLPGLDMLWVTIWEGLQQEGERDEGKTQSNTWLFYLNRAVVHAPAREWRGLEDHCSDLSRPPSRVGTNFFFESSHSHNNELQ